MTHGASGMWVLVLRGRRVDPLPLAWERSREILIHEGFRDRTEATISNPKMGDTLGLLASKGKECVSNATSLDT